MKVKFRFGIETYSGKIDGMVYNSCRKDHLCIGREFVYPVLTPNNAHLGAAMKNLALVYKTAAAAYKADLKKYAARNGQENVGYDQMVPTGYSCFVKMMYAWQKTDPTHIDLTAVTIADILSDDADVVSISRAVGAGYLPAISDYTTLTAVIGV